MSSYTTPLVVELLDGKRWRLVFSFTYHIGSKYAKRFIAVDAGFLTDWASIPKFLWFFPYWAKYNKASLLHDYLYHNHILSRAEADQVFYEAMLVMFRHHKSGRIIAWVEYWAVRVFGIWAY